MGCEAGLIRNDTKIKLNNYIIGRKHGILTIDKIGYIFYIYIVCSEATRTPKHITHQMYTA